MKKNFVALALVAAGAFGVSGVQANDLTGWFVNGGAGRENHHALREFFRFGQEQPGVRIECDAHAAGGGNVGDGADLGDDVVIGVG